jgi:hypothetical protein
MVFTSTYAVTKVVCLDSPTRRGVLYDIEMFYIELRQILGFHQILYELRGYHTLQGDNSLKSVERFDHMIFVCRFQASQ